MKETGDEKKRGLFCCVSVRVCVFVCVSINGAARTSDTTRYWIFVILRVVEILTSRDEMDGTRGGVAEIQVCNLVCLVGCVVCVI